MTHFESMPVNLSSTPKPFSVAPHLCRGCYCSNDWLVRRPLTLWEWWCFFRKKWGPSEVNLMLFEKKQKKMEIFSFAAILSTDSHHLFHSEPICRIPTKSIASCSSSRRRSGQHFVFVMVVSLAKSASRKVETKSIILSLKLVWCRATSKIYRTNHWRSSPAL